MSSFCCSFTAANGSKCGSLRTTLTAATAGAATGAEATAAAATAAAATVAAV